MRSIRNPIDAAGVLMRLLARGTPMSEQEAATEAELRAIVPPGDDLTARLVYIRHVAHQIADADTAQGDLAPLLREKLTAFERADLERMLGSVAAIHQGPILAQEGLLARTTRSLIQTD